MPRQLRKLQAFPEMPSHLRKCLISAIACDIDIYKTVLQWFTDLISFRNSCVLRWEGVPVETEVANPEFGPKVNPTHRVEDGPAALTAAHNWFVLDWG